MFLGLTTRQVTRSVLASQINLGTDSVIGFNQKIVLYSPLINFANLTVTNRPNTYLEILSPSPNQGVYTVLNPEKNYIEIYEQALLTQPINQSQFAYRLSNAIYSGTDINVTQRNIFIFSDVFLKNSILDNNVESEETNPLNPWKIKYYTSYPSTYNVYIISAINPDGSVVLKDDNTLPPLTQSLSINNINYELLNSNNDSIYTSFDGNLFCFNNGIVTVNDGNFGDAKERLKIGNYFYYSLLNEQYQIVEYGFEENVFVVCSWNNGNVTGQSGKVLNRIVEETTGNLSYKGMVIEKPTSMLEIENPNSVDAVENNQFKENFILVIDDNLYKIEDYYSEGATDYLILGGLKLDLTTQLAGGTSLSVNSIQLTKNEYAFQNNKYKKVVNESFQANHTNKITNVTLENTPVVAGSVNGRIYYRQSIIQTFSISPSGIFKFNDVNTNYSRVISGEIVFSTGQILFSWSSIPINYFFEIDYEYSTQENSTVCSVDKTGFDEITGVDENNMVLNICNSSSFAFGANFISSLEKQGENSKINDIIKQEENIGFKIETVDGQTFEGNLT